MTYQEYIVMYQTIVYLEKEIQDLISFLLWVIHQ